MALQNRVDPFGELQATTARGALMGNRGGHFHRGDRTLTARRWTSRRWICCRLAFKNRCREVWGKGYTELFFLDEVTALAAGHRPCFECRRRDAGTFAALWGQARGLGRPATADEMDRVLDVERRAGRRKRRHSTKIDDLPDGVIVVDADDGDPYALRAGTLRRWTAFGYRPARPRPAGILVEVLTPPSVVAVLAGGYAPLWHAQGTRA